MAGLHSIESGNESKDRGFVVARRTGVDSRFRIIGVRTSVIRILANQRWLPRVLLPLRFVNWLAVIVRVEGDGPLGWINLCLRQNHRWRMFNFQEPGLQSALLQYLRQGVGVLLNVDFIAGQVGQRKKGLKLLQDGGPVLGNVGADRLVQGRSLRLC